MKRERLDKVLSHLGFGSRTDVKRIIGEGRVSINLQIQKDPSFKISLEDELSVDSEILLRKEQYYFMMNKAPDCITATEDPKEKTVMDYLKGRHRRMPLFPVGRLDKETEGLLILTTDGDFAHRYTSPKHLIEKTYFALVQGEVTSKDQEKFKQGIRLEDGYQTLPAELTILEAGETSKVEIRIKEGKYRQIRRMFVMLEKEVLYLKRIQMGSISLDESLKVGEYRALTPLEEASL
ncbi:pseudouridine synthase [Leptospira ryugenii]|uniref:Pseudouridine synthase n=1 Tax=Leptospira ryugenii TaxID=1917863 RepID=A0A2P2DYF1_9LEPT|nr:pseudouridine synthase [Leptospira ryugenii]GBF49659.1 pseudouridine synthase [Leptospira ryugenii]